MATVFDGDTLTITTDTPIGGVLELSVQRLYSEWKEWQLASFQNMGYPPAFRVVGGDDLTPGIKAGAYYFLRNDYGWRIKSTEADQTVYVEGNLAPQDSSLEVIRPTDGDFTVAFIGLQPVTQSVDELLTGQQSVSFDGKVAIATLSGTAGTAYPIGTESQPVSNLADAITIANREGIVRFSLRGTITLSQTFSQWEFMGHGSHETAVVELNSQNVNGSSFRNIEIKGAGTGEIDAIECSLDLVSGVSGLFHRCGFDNDVTLGTGKTIFTDCFSQVPGTGRPTLDCNNVAVDCALRRYAGGLELDNLSAGAVTVDGTPVRLRMTAACTNGAELVVGGNGIIDSNLGTIVPVADSFMSNEEVRDHVLAATIESTFTLQDVMRLLAAAAAGTIEQAIDGTYTIRGIDGTTARILGQLGTNNGRDITSRDVG